MLYYDFVYRKDLLKIIDDDTAISTIVSRSDVFRDVPKQTGHAIQFGYTQAVLVKIGSELFNIGLPFRHVNFTLMCIMLIVEDEPDYFSLSHPPNPLRITLTPGDTPRQTSKTDSAVRGQKGLRVGLERNPDAKCKPEAIEVIINVPMIEDQVRSIFVR